MELFSIFLALLALVLVFMFFTFVPVGLWVTAYFAGVKVSMGTLIGMRIRRVVPSRIIYPMIKATKAGIPVEINRLEAQFLAGGNVDRVVDALIAADKAGIKLTFGSATAIDLAGRDVLEAVRVSVNPKVITTPMVAGMAQDGIQLLATARITVRANIERLVGGAGEETIIARVGEGIVASIGSTETHKQVLEQPDRISKTVLAKGLDAGTAFEILSVDIAELDVGKNIGAQLRTDQAEADKKVAQAKAEERRAMAVAAEQENRAEVEAMRAKLVEAQAAVPLGLAEALKAGRIGVMDYYQIKNIEADTDMRESISKSTAPEPGSERK
ncbi:MAG: flotillin-like protein FloA [Deinococcus sp.]|nr:flotillin-like protein FloA [Deinococcus sp.]MCL5965124.1 flotillin-like protein FloA [Deinococcus sp.]